MSDGKFGSINDVDEQSDKKKYTRNSYRLWLKYP